MNGKRSESRQHYDLLVVGGGVNGAGIARDAAGRGLSVLLVEQDDLGAHTSSSSTKLIHGGLRYMERLHVGLVRKALKEREVVLDSAPHISWPLRFVIPHDERLRSAWMIRIGLVLYDNLARRRRLAASHGIDLRRHVAGTPLRSGFRRGFVYSDGWVDDARLVVLNALDAAERGATVRVRTRCVTATRQREHWRVVLHDRLDGRSFEVTARVLVNATGPWAGDFAHTALPRRPTHRIRLVKGSHIVVPRLYDHPFAYIFQNDDRRVIFAIPYERDFTLIGTTDVQHSGDPADVAIDAAEVEYLCASVNRYFAKPIAPADVVWAYAGVRPLLDDESSELAAVTRDYTLELDDEGPPLLSVFGGKITTFRRLAEQALSRIATALGRPDRQWTAGHVLPGGDLPGGDFDAWLRSLDKTYPWLPAELRKRYAHAYGTRMARLLESATSLQDLGAEVLPGLYAREIDYLCDVEWARTAEDVLWRRTKLGLHMADAGAADATLTAYLARRSPAPARTRVSTDGVAEDA
ncbi:MAG TPA: glycerol-3-phosphate dehydrogenase [Steroidobacteraceae bacterium]|nr:glycerol-3-phosphate dehydrogenase [Steroidobacteraceae bacterium]